MKILFIALVFGAVLALSGCAFSDHAQIAWLDSSRPHYDAGALMEQPIRSNPQVYLTTRPERPYRIIAVFSVTGNSDEEPKALQSFVDFAARSGADLLIIDHTIVGSHLDYNANHLGAAQIDGTNTLGNGGNLNARASLQQDTSLQYVQPGDRCIYRAQAAVWTAEPASRAASGIKTQ